VFTSAQPRRCPVFARISEPVVAKRKTVVRHRQTNDISLDPFAAKRRNVVRSGQANEIAVQPHRYRERLKRWPTGDGPEALSPCRQITTSLGRLLAFIRLLLDLPARVVLSLEATRVSRMTVAEVG